MDNRVSSFRFLLVLLGLCIFSTFLVCKESEEDRILESIPLDVYDLIVQDNPNATTKDIIRIYQEEKDILCNFSVSSDSSFQ